jgi:hypothetical protein
LFLRREDRCGYSLACSIYPVRSIDGLGCCERAEGVERKLCDLHRADKAKYFYGLTRGIIVCPGITHKHLALIRRLLDASVAPP